ncbi:MAG: hypothetical protein AAGD14_18765 [Planctomycetota bacterium]
MIRGLAIGLLAGLGVGWVLFTSDAPRRNTTPRETASKPATPEAAAPQPQSEPVVPMRPRFTQDTPTGLTINTNPDGSKSYQIAGQLIGPRPIAEIDANIAQARQDKNWPEFYACLLEYGVLGTKEGDERMIAILGDTILSLPGPWIGERFYECLYDTEADGILEAARARAKIELEEKAGTRWEGRGFLGLVARFGSPADFAWLDTLRAGRGRSSEIDHALMQGSANPLAAERLTQSLLKNGLPASSRWRIFVERNPEAAHACAVRLLEADGESTSIGRRDTRQNFELLFAATNESTRAQTLDVIAGLTSDAQRLAAARELRTLERNGIDLAGFESIMETPHRVLATASTDRARDRLARDAIGAISRAPPLWTAQNLAALESVRDGPNKLLSEHAAVALESIEKYRRKRSGWEPERGS